MGIFEVASFAARIVGVPAVATMIDTSRVTRSAASLYPLKSVQLRHHAAILIKGRNCHDHCCCYVQAPARNVSRKMAREHQTGFCALSECARPDPQAIPYGGGVCLWETREAAENCYYKSPWAENVRKASGGNEPEIAWFETGVVVDNESHQIKTAA
jgi:hypothetical protein